MTEVLRIWAETRVMLLKPTTMMMMNPGGEEAVQAAARFIKSRQSNCGRSRQVDITFDGNPHPCRWRHAL